MKQDECRYCKAPIVFLTTKNGHAMPTNIKNIDAETAADRKFVYGKHESHFATCPKSKKARADAQAKRDARKGGAV